MYIFIKFEIIFIIDINIINFNKKINKKRDIFIFILIINNFHRFFILII